MANEPKEANNIKEEDDKKPEEPSNKYQPMSEDDINLLIKYGMGPYA